VFVVDGRRAVFTALTFAAVVVAGVVGAPAARAQTGCAAGLVLMDVPEVLRTLAAPGSEAAIRAGDQNRDGYLCVQIAPGGGLARFADNQ
jgi:hypothetical protein